MLFVNQATFNDASCKGRVATHVSIEMPPIQDTFFFPKIRTHIANSGIGNGCQETTISWLLGNHLP